MKKKETIYLIVALLWALPAPAQQVLLDRPVKAAELTLFPDVNDPNVYYYVSDKPRIATDAAAKPQFSFLRYVENVRSAASQPEAREGEGGGIFHALVALAVTPEQLQDAKRELQRLKPGAQIQGPVVYRSGKFGLVSSFKDADGKLTTKVVGLGNAPILDGNKAAVSLQLTKLGAKILWESFETTTPDISFSFEMEVAGFRSPIRGVIEANFDQIYEHRSFGAGIASTYLAAEIKDTFDDLRRQGAIKLTQVGSDEKLDALITTAYNKIADMMFSPIGGTGTPSLDSLTSSATPNSSLLDRATTLLSRSREEAQRENERIRRENREAEDRRTRDRGSVASNSTNNEATTNSSIPLVARQRGVRPPSHVEPEGAPAASTQREGTVPSFAVVAAYEMKRVRQQGIFKVDLNKFTTDRLTLRFDENIGNLQAHRSDPSHFRQVNLDDPLYKQREIVAFVDGSNAQDFGQYINFVTVQMRKKHAGGAITDDELRIDRRNFNAEGNNFKLLYGWKDDNDRRRWMEYDYKATWSFFGGRTVEQPWQTTDSGAINLAPPYQRRVIDIQASPDAVASGDVRAITVKIFYKLADAEQIRQVTLNTSKGLLSERIEIAAPSNSTDYDFEVVWQLKGNRMISSGRKTTSGAIISLDNVPSA